jgi:hypothetical protein
LGLCKRQIPEEQGEKTGEFSKTLQEIVELFPESADSGVKQGSNSIYDSAGRGISVDISRKPGQS